jgi:WD40 repeat protein/serine/threonine protein kinase
MKCPHCNSEFHSLTGPAPRCPQCGEALQVSDDLLLPPDARDAAGRGEEATVDFPPLGDSGTPDAVQPPGGSEHETTNLGSERPSTAPADDAVETTIDLNINRSSPNATGSEAATFDFPSNQDRSGSDSSKPVSNENKTIDFDAGQSQSGINSNEPLGNEDKTIDLESEEGLSSPATNATAGNEDKTINYELTQPETDSTEIGATIDLQRRTADTPRSTSAAPDTVDSRKADATVDFELSQSEKRLNSESGTIDFDINDIGIPDDGKTIQLATAAERVSNQRIEKMTQEWSTSADDGISPMTSLKTKTSGSKGDSTLVIPERVFRGSEEQAAMKADYDLLELLGEGGMGVVYAARQASIDRTVAVKMLKPESASERNVRRKFLSEAVVTGDLEHPNIVPIYDVGARHDGALFYAMKRVQGTPWQDVIDDKSLSENLEILMKVADAVAFAHSKDVIHRDLKPENVMLGDFGEVLVMDWGLAVPTDRRSLGGIAPSAGMGGTPAYMAPEMALGPFDSIGKQSDIYLLGAILFHIVSGKPPHRGKGAMACLKAAARNEIVEFEDKNELTRIALKAMATKPAERYQSVGEFQTAIRDYLAHAESIELVKRASLDVELGNTTGDYECFQRALFGFQESLKLWDGYETAKMGARTTRIDYARCAKDKGDLDLGLSLLEEEDAEHRQLAEEINIEKAERDARQQRLRTAKQLTAALALALLVGGVIAFAWIYLAMKEARTQTRKAVTAQLEEQKQKDIAVAAEKDALDAKEVAVAAEKDALDAKEVALAAEKDALDAKEVALAAEKDAVKQRKDKEYEAYIAEIGLAAAKIDENAFGYAREILEQSQKGRRNWEWGRLMHMCSQSIQDFKESEPIPIEAVSFGPAGQRFATGNWEGTATIWEIGNQKRPLLTVEPGGSHIYSVALSPNGNWLVTAGDHVDRPLQMWNAATGELHRVLEGHEGPVTTAQFSHDGKLLLTGSYDKTARVWNVDTGEEVKKLVGHTWWIWDAGFSPDDRQIVTASQDGTVLVWSVADGQRSDPFRGHRGPVYTATFSPNGKSIASAGNDRRILLWDPSDLKPFDYEALAANNKVPLQDFAEMQGHTAAVRRVQYSANGKQLLSCGHDNTVRLWDIAERQLVKTLRGHDSWVRDCTFSPDGEFVLSAGHDKRAKLWTIDGYEEYRVLRGRIMRGHRDDILSAGISTDGNTIVTASRDRTARTWDAATGQPKMLLEEGHAYLASSATFFPDGDRLLTSAMDNSTRIWDVASGVELKRINGTGRYAAAALSPDGQWVLTGSLDRAAQLWAVESGEMLRALDGHKVAVSATAFSRDGARAASGDINGRVRVWNTADWSERYDLNAHTARISTLVFSPDGSRLLSASRDNTVAQWDLATGKESVDRILKHPDQVTSLDLSSDGRLAITSCFDGQVRVWNVATAQVQTTLPVEEQETSDARFSPTGRLAVTVHSESRLVKLWDLQSGREIAVQDEDGKTAGPLLDLERIGALVWAARFTDDGQYLLTVGGDEARLWNVKSRKEMLRFSPHNVVASAEFSKDGKRVVTGGWDGSARIWNAASGKAIVKMVAGDDTGNERQGKAINSAVFSPDEESRFVLTASDDGTAHSWDSETGKLVAEFKGHDDRVLWAVFSADGQQVLTTSSDKTARVWDASTGKQTGVLDGHKWSVLHGQFSTDGQFIVTGGADNISIVWNAKTFEVWKTLRGHTASVTSVTFSPDGSRVLTASEDHSAKLWDPITAKEILTLNGHTEEVTSVRFSADGLNVLTASRDGTSILWLAEPWPAETSAVAPSDAFSPRF